MTASQQSQRRERRVAHGASSIPTILNAPKGIQQQSGIEEPEFEQARHVRAGKQLAGTSVPPKCAVLFDNLRRAHWSYFGIPSDIKPGFDIRQMHIEAVEPDAVYEVLRPRLGLLFLYRDFVEAVEQATASGMTEQAAEIFASRKLMLDLGKTIPEETDVDKFVKGFDFRIKVAKRIASLVEAIGVIEVLLISIDEDEISLPQDIPALTFIELDDEEWISLLSRLLNPYLQLKETCLKLSGVVRMIQQLDGMGESALRPFLAQEIRRRVEDVFGESNQSDDDDNSMADVETDIF
ncbi:uncharacterized protein N7473_005404 [Penicillium subrubescens]|nr:uncharacterized protein N7473_005404 [Penicillium subrubescens]KAJ5896005.1 hypothetical protein N7473_005404 [Penicillium subrubescens]